jgi:hypothetical protein
MIKSAMTCLGVTDLPVHEEILVDEAVTNLARLKVVVLNSTTGDELQYSEHPDRQIVAVGGNRLSRGLTLEGLTIAYFLRTTTLADTLLQMARWYGFRAGYEDLIRIWTTEGIAQWFGELALVEESLRDSIVALNRAGRRPDEMAIRIRAHSELLLTSKSKSKMLVEDARSWSGGNPQTILFPLHDGEALARNFELTSAMLRQHPPTQDAHGGAIAHDIPAEDVAFFLRQFQGHPNSIAFQGPEMADWIMECTARGELVGWTIFVANPRRDRQALLGGRPYGLVHRSLQAGESIGILIDPRHEGVDLHGGPENYQSASGFNAKAMREDRPPTQGLLLLYPLDPEPLRAPTQAVIGVALSLPRTGDGARPLLVNRGLL